MDTRTHARHGSPAEHVTNRVARRLAVVATGALLVMLSLLLPMPAVAQPPSPTAIERLSICPPGYTTHREYCLPGPNARAAIRRIEICPPGYTTHRDYCLATSRATHAIPRRGVCPPGYSTWRQYCLQRSDHR